MDDSPAWIATQGVLPAEPGSRQAGMDGRGALRVANDATWRLLVRAARAGNRERRRIVRERPQISVI
ncbi:MAG TPA: hypothetical protein VFD43_05685 [Planctomycetota bacterium]|nr:hypothetical protein [Planctomycetota bacterium]